MEATRAATAADHGRMIEAIRLWWGDSRSPAEARELSRLLPRLFLEHFSGTSLVVEDDGRLAAFLVGFHSADRPEQAYIHFVGVDPERRRAGLAAGLYRTFFDRAQRSGRTTIRAITSPANRGSIAFHRRLGFALEPGDHEVNCVPVHRDHDGPGEHRVCFRLDLTGH